MRYAQARASERGKLLKPIATGGAGRQIMQFLRNFMEPIDPAGDAFKKLEPLSVIFNVQPDWKTWDVDPLLAIAPSQMPVTYTGESLREWNAANRRMTLPKLADPRDLSPWDDAEKTMQLNQGFVVAINPSLQNYMTQLARDFEFYNPSCPLRSTDYEYKKAIMAFAGR